jgi:FtsH-binding integral membrane protein
MYNTTYENSFQTTAANAAPATRAAFIRRTYAHLAGALLAFAGLEYFLISSGIGAVIAQTMLSVSWLLVLAAFMGVSFLANWWANGSTSRPMQYLGLALYVVAQAVIFLPLLFIVNATAGGGVIAEAGVYTLGLFGALTTIVFITRRDFSFLGPILMIGGFLALGFIAVSLLFGFSLGSLFALVMVGFAAASILYDTSNVLHRYHTDQHVAASLSLFASVALLFWYILQILGYSRDE